MPPSKPDHDKHGDAPAPAPSTAGPAPSSAPEPVRSPSAPEPVAVFSPDELLMLLVCPICSGDLEAYTGDNPHKIGSAWCRHCGQRVRAA